MKSKIKKSITAITLTLLSDTAFSNWKIVSGSQSCNIQTTQHICYTIVNSQTHYKYLHRPEGGNCRDENNRRTLGFWTCYIWEKNLNTKPCDHIPGATWHEEKEECVEPEPIKCPQPYFLSNNGDECQAYCTTGETWDPTSESCIAPPQEENCKTQSSNPIDFIEGRKYRSEHVLNAGVRHPFSLTYFFNNQGNQETSPVGSKIAVIPGNRYLAATKPPISNADYQIAFNNRGTPIGSTLHLTSQYYGSLDQYWRHSFDDVLLIHGAQYIYKPAKGNEIRFNGLGPNAAYSSLRLSALAVNEESFSGYKLSNHRSREVKKFNSNGQLIKIERAPNDILTLTYDNQNRLERITNSEGAYIQLSYQNLTTNTAYSVSPTNHSYVSNITNNRGESSQIQWEKSHIGKTATFHLITQITDAHTNLTQSVRTFEYNNTHWPISITDVYFVPDITNGNIRRALLHFEYDHLGRAIFSGLTGKQSDSISYVDSNTRVITNALGKAATYYFEDFNGTKRLHRVVGEPTQNCVRSEVEYQYDNSGNIIQKNENGRITQYQYDSLGRETSRTEAFGTSYAKTINTQYHPTLSLPIKIIEPGLITEMTYNTEGKLTLLKKIKQ